MALKRSPVEMPELVRWADVKVAFIMLAEGNRAAGRPTVADELERAIDAIEANGLPDPKRRPRRRP